MLEFLTLHPDAFGLDISDFSLKIAYLKKKQKGFHLASFGGGELEQGIIEGGEIQKEEQLQAAIQKTLKQLKGRKIHTKYVVAALPEEKAFVQVIQLPRMKKEELMSTIRFQAESFIPYPIDTVYLDFAVITPFHDHIDHLDVLVASLPRQVVDSYVSVLEKAGLVPAVLEIDAIALCRAVVKKGVSPIPLLVVDIGQRRSKVSIFSGYSVRFTTSLSVSARDFTAAIAKSLHVDEEKAEEFKHQYGLYAPEDALGQEVFQAMIPVATDFIEQIAKYLEYYETHLPHQHLLQPQKKIERIMLCGGGANLKGFPEFLTRALKVQVAVGNPWVNILSPQIKELPPLSLQESLGYSTALGLALRGAQVKELYDQSFAAPI